MPKEKSVILATLNIENNSAMSLQELCEAYHLSPEWVEEIIDFGVVQPIGQPDEIRFTEADIQRIRTILHLQTDLEINIAGAALVVDLMQELEELRARIDVLEKYFNQG